MSPRHSHLHIRTGGSWACEARLKLLHSIDGILLEEERSLQDSVSRICDAIESALSVHCTAYAILGDNCLPVAGTDLDNAAGRAFPLPEPVRSAVAHGVPVASDPSGEHVYLHTHATPHLQLLLTLREHSHRPHPADLGTEDCTTFLAILASQIGLVLACAERAAFARMKEALIGDVLANELKPARCWKAIVTHIAALSAGTAPFAVPPPLLVQIFTYTGGDRFLVLRASQDWDDTRHPRQGTVSAMTIPLRLEATPLGVLVERNLDYLSINPTEKAQDRDVPYILGDRAPQSELALPVRHAGDLVGILNLEHPAPDAFNQYQREMLRCAALVVAPVVHALVSHEYHRRSRELASEYVMTKLLRRMAFTYRHKTGQLLLNSRIAITALEKAVDASNADAMTPLNELRGFLTDFQNRSKTFLRELPCYVVYGETDTCAAIREAIGEFDPDSLREHEGVTIDFRPLAPAPSVYASPMLREHICNLVHNSIEALEEAQRKPGQISITMHREGIRDAQEEEGASPARICVRIVDNAGGVSSEIEDRLFDFGFTTRSTRGGTGFGLPAAREYLQSIGGRLEMDNRPGVGMTVTMYLDEYTPDYHEHVSERELGKGGGNVRS